MRLDQLEHARDDVARVVEQRLVGVQRQVGQHDHPPVARIGGEAAGERGGQRRPSDAAGSGHRHQPSRPAPGPRRGGGGVVGGEVVAAADRPGHRAQGVEQVVGAEPDGQHGVDAEVVGHEPGGPAVVGRHDRASVRDRRVHQVAVEGAEAGVDDQRRERPARTAAGRAPPPARRP